MALDPAAVVRAYRVTFGSPDGVIVLNDLMRVCQFRTLIHDQIGEGMRRAFLHILEFSQLSDEQITALYRGRGLTLTIAPEEDTDGRPDYEP